jgi:hypothetical protein
VKDIYWLLWFSKNTMQLQSAVHQRNYKDVSRKKIPAKYIVVIWIIGEKTSTNDPIVPS